MLTILYNCTATSQLRELSMRQETCLGTFKIYDWIKDPIKTKCLICGGLIIFIYLYYLYYLFIYLKYSPNGARTRRLIVTGRGGSARSAVTNLRAAAAARRRGLPDWK